MANLKKQLKEMRKAQERYNESQRAYRSICPHVSKKGKSWLETFDEDGIQKGRCRKCGDVVIVDRDLLTKQSTEASAEIVKTMVAELRAADATGKIDLDDETKELLIQFDSKVLRDLPEALQQLSGKKKKKEKFKGEKKYKKAGKKHKRIRYS